MKKSLAYLSFKRKERLEKIAGMVYRDNSAIDLRRWRSDGYKRVAFVTNRNVSNECENQICQSLNGTPYYIDDLLQYDNPLFRTSHVNCQCSFAPIPE